MLRPMPLLVTALTGCTFYVSGSSGSGDAGSGSGFDALVPDGHVTTDAPDDSANPPLGDAAIVDSLFPPFDSFINLDGLIPPFDVNIPPPPDAATNLVETLIVPCNGQIIVSQNVFSSSTQYRVRASGTCKVDSFFNNEVFADAEYFSTAFPRDRENGVDIGIGLYDTTLGFDKPPNWGFYNPGHVYEVTGPGFDVPLTVRFHDKGNNAYGDNTGSLMLEIFAL